MHATELEPKHGDQKKRVGVTPNDADPVTILPDRGNHTNRGASRWEYASPPITPPLGHQRASGGLYEQLRE
jgi:hypothetical protein